MKQTIGQKILIGLIQAYQQFSAHLWTGPGLLFMSGCRAYPTCSEYGIRAVSEYGSVRGVLKTLGRVAKCNPLMNERNI